MNKKYCVLRREEMENKSYVNYDALYFIHAENRTDKNAWRRTIRSYAQRIDEHYIVVSEDEFLTSTGMGIVTKFSILKVEHDKKTAEDYCLDQCRKLTKIIADPLGCEVEDFTLEKVVQN